MNRWLMAIGGLMVLVALGFVCPQLAELRIRGALAGGGVALLMLGVLGTLAGAACVAVGLKRESSRLGS